jgi:ArsR family transcriptional regulator
MPKPLPVVQPVQSVPDGVACCAPLADAPLAPDQAQVLATQLKALADPARLRLLSILLASPDLEACTCNLTDPLGLTQPTVTHHLRRLLDANLVTAERRGVWTYYRAVPQALAVIAGALTPEARAGVGIGT